MTNATSIKVATVGGTVPPHDGNPVCPLDAFLLMVGAHPEMKGVPNV